MILRSYQNSFVEAGVKALKEHGNGLGVAATGAGKCLGAGTPILMYDGTIKNVEDVCVGDLLMGPDSSPRNVKSLARGREEMFRVFPIKGESFAVNRSHILSLVISGDRKVCGYMSNEVVNISVDEYLEMGKNFKHCAKGWRAGVDFEKKNVEFLIPPYILGVWLGDGGNVNENGFANPDREVIEEIVAYADCIGMRVRSHYDGDKCPMHFITTGERSPHANHFKRALRHLNLPGNKHVPYAYKTASRRERLEVLAGLMDTDGHQTHGGYDFISKDKALAEDVAFIARSLGLAAYVKDAWKKAQGWSENKLYYRVRINGDCSIIPCRVERKKAPVRRQKKDVLRFGFNIESIGEGDYFGFAIEGPDRLFMLGDFTVTHNTVMLSEICKRVGGKQVVLVHREEINTQNFAKFRKVAPGVRAGMFTADIKTWNGDTTFAMVQTLCREKNLDTMPKLDMLVVDEAHHVCADSYTRIIDRAKEMNPKVKILGVTATPRRADGIGLRKVFSNVFANVSISQLVSLGYLVRPRTMLATLPGTKERLKNLKKKGHDFDMDEVASIMDLTVHNQSVVDHWKKVAADRKTIVFCSNVAHARHVTDTFVANGVRAECVTGETPDAERAAIFKRLDRGSTQVLVNVSVATEGFDSQPVSCVVLLRPSSSKSTLIQMIGRGLRVVDPEIYPGVVKKDCLVLDFGQSLATHKSLDQSCDLDDRKKLCPGCGAMVPQSETECSLCGHEFVFEAGTKIKGIGIDGEEQEEIIEAVELLEVDIFQQSPFRWVDLFDTSRVMVACGFEAWVSVVSPDGETWTALGKQRGKKMQKLAIGERVNAISVADDFLRMIEQDDAAKKTKRWLTLPISDKQLDHLTRVGYSSSQAMSLSRYSGVCALNFAWSRREIEGMILK